MSKEWLQNYIIFDFPKGNSMGEECSRAKSVMLLSRLGTWVSVLISEFQGISLAAFVAVLDRIFGLAKSSGKTEVERASW